VGSARHGDREGLAMRKVLILPILVFLYGLYSLGSITAYASDVIGGKLVKYLD
jgi:hypothetical protein